MQPRHSLHRACCSFSARFLCRHAHKLLPALRSSARNEKRLEAMRECIRMITTIAGGCCTPFPFEAAIWLLEEQEELYGGVFPVYGDVRCLPLSCCAACVAKTGLATRVAIEMIFDKHAVTRQAV